MIHLRFNQKITGNRTSPEKQTIPSIIHIVDSPGPWMRTRISMSHKNNTTFVLMILT